MSKPKSLPSTARRRTGLHPYHLRVILVVLATGLYFLTNIQRVAIPGAIFSILQQDLGASAPAITALGSSFMYIYACCQLVTGVLAERYGGIRVMLVGAMFFCLGSLIFPYSSSLPWLYFARALAGLGASSFYLCLIKEIKHCSSDKNFSIMLSFMVLSGFCGGIVANAPFVACVELMGWRRLLLLLAQLSLLLYVLFALCSRGVRKPPIRQEMRFNLKTFATVLRVRHNLHVYTFSGINFGMYYVIQTVIGKKFIEDYCGMSSNNAALIFSLMAILSALSGLSFATMSRMLGNRRCLFLRIAGVMGIIDFSIIVLHLVMDWRSPYLAVFFCLLALTASTASITVPLMHETNDPDKAGSAISIMNFVSFIFVAILGNVVGYLMNLHAPLRDASGVLVYSRGSYLAVFLVLLTLSFFSANSAWRLQETMGKRRKVR
ncbi:MAG: MFS transporter [Lentisphaerae bacterium]|nr:MFS transporter [Lentisphaerota bacterium]